MLKPRAARSLALSLFWLAAGCREGSRAEAPPGGAPLRRAPPRAEPSRSARAVFQQGRASYYADSLAGRPTASGEPYDPRALTAAHRTLPFGTRLLVTTSNGRSVRVRINDRGPYAKGRIIDLSRAAAEAIGMLWAGVVDVSLFVEP